MEKKPFEFPTYKEFEDEFVWQAHVMLCGEPGNAKAQIAHREGAKLPHIFWKSPSGNFVDLCRWKRIYAMEFLAALKKYINGDFPNIESYMATESGYSFASYKYPMYIQGTWHGEFMKDIRDGDRFSLFNIDASKFDEFLAYKGSGTSTVEQLNILYNIK